MAYPAYSHIVVVMLENHSFAEIVGNGQCPYINSLIAGGFLLTNYFAVSHPSEPNYLATYGGDTFGVLDDGTYGEPDPSLFTALKAVGKTFQGIIESGSPRKHNPWESFPEGTSVELTLTAPIDLTKLALPHVAFLSPNTNDDMHTGSIATCDGWLKTNIDSYAQWTKANNALLVLWWDEDDGTQNNQVPCVLYGAGITAGSKNATKYNHYSLLRFLCESMGATPMRNAASATPFDASIFASPAPSPTPTPTPTPVNPVSDAAAIQALLNQVAGGEFVTIPPGVYSIDTPLTINFTTQQEWMGLSAYGVRLNSALTVAEPVLTITVAPNLYIRGLRMSGLTIIGGATETHGLAINCTQSNGMLYNFALRDLAMENCNGDGLNAVGAIFEGVFDNVCPRNNKGNGATLGNPPSGTPGIMSSNKWRNGSCGQNTGSGMSLVGYYYDLDIDGTYFLENGGPGLALSNGLTLMRGGGFENNQAGSGGGPAIHGANFGTFVAVTEGGNNKQNSLMNGWYNVGTLNLIGCHPAHGIGTINGTGGRVNLIGSSDCTVTGSVQKHLV